MAGLRAPFFPRPQQSGKRKTPGVKTYNYYLGGGGGGGSSLAGQYQQAMNRANRANEKRYGQLMQGYDGLYGRVMGQLNSVGNQQAEDIKQRYRDAESANYQRLVNRGFGNSTMLNTMKQGTVRETNRDLARLAESLAMAKAQADMNISQNKLGVIERRNDIGPDYGQMIALAQSLGRSGYGQGGMGGGGVMPPNIDLRAMQQQFLMSNLAKMRSGSPWTYKGKRL